MNFSDHATRIAGVVGSALMLALMVPSPGMADEEKGLEMPVVVETNPAEHNCISQRIEQRFLQCGATSATGTVAGFSVVVPVYGDCYPVPTIHPGQGGPTLLIRK
ncbi:hypothetical protein BLJ79_15260 [Arthrobacter sp. UCD-GKA]|uniref:hypothetical protein n=1 Tax=Arthrobacter sp. UCD-GKA TaxID=1913576 RepID=UPI0008DE9978|nr:hypothetical protein [Arthrobacter sp. UCD-GKA]OIH83436.1 hypothetical protein BLJ79_15260 [Arthrobacter sp. UCD-GKA]